MPRFSLNNASEEASRFFRREAGILLPVALATFGLGMMLISLVTPATPAQGQVQPGLWMLAIVPAIVAGLIGQLAISLLVLRPGVSVAEALRGAFARLPRALLVVLLLWLAALVALLLIAILLGVVLGLTGASLTAITLVSATIVVVMLIWLAARILFVWPMLVDRDGGAVATVRAAWRIAKGNTGRLVAALFAFGLVYLVVTGAVQLVFGSLFLIVGKAIGSEGAARFLAALVVAIVASALQALWAVFVTMLYRGAAEPTNGS